MAVLYMQARNFSIINGDSSTTHRLSSAINIGIETGKAGSERKSFKQENHWDLI